MSINLANFSDFPSLCFKVAEIFSKLEKIRSSCMVEDYSVTQTSLDHVFIRFAKQQADSLDSMVVLPGADNAESVSLSRTSMGADSRLNLIV